MGSVPKTKKKNIPKSINEMSQEKLQETLKKKRECNAKALQTVERLCEPCVDEEWFLASLEFINQCHFEDVTIERAIAKICGYPLCSEKLEKVPSQQYHISTRYNKVFDITERKNFCSSSCYKSAVHVKKQLFTSPLWFRDQEVIPKYTVLKSMKSSLGEEVVFLPDKIKPELDVSKQNHSVDEVGFDEVGSDKNIAELEKKCSNLEINNDQDDNVQVEKEKKIVTSQTNCGAQNEIKERIKPGLEETPMKTMGGCKRDEVKDVKPKTKTKDKPVSVIEKVEECVFEWFSLDTFFYLYGEEKLKELLQDKAAVVKEMICSKLKLAGRNEKINRMIQLYGLLDTDSFSSSEVNTNLKPLPDYSILKEEGKTLEIKVRAFYQGQLQPKQPEKEETEKDKDEDSKVDPEPNYLPLIDAHAQIALRRKIILDKLSKVLPEMIKIFNADYTLQMTEVRNLVSTFSLSAHNITFRPTVWYLIGIILLKLLSIKDKTLDATLKSDSSKSQVLIVLKSYELGMDYLDNLIVKLTDSGNLMEKLNDINR